MGNFSLQPEGRGVADLLRALRPELSANLHGGSVVANYPMDACDSLVGSCSSMSQRYTSTHAPVEVDDAWPNYLMYACDAAAAW